MVTAIIFRSRQLSTWFDTESLSRRNADKADATDFYGFCWNTGLKKTSAKMTQRVARFAAPCCQRTLLICATSQKLVVSN